MCIFNNLNVENMKYDYKVEIISPYGLWGTKNDNYEKILNEYGESGYELVQIITKKDEYHHIFKKRLNE